MHRALDLILITVQKKKKKKKEKRKEKESGRREFSGVIASNCTLFLLF
jgi:hypothetical protein